MSVLRGLVPPRGPVRILAIGGLARTTGFGILVSVSVLFFTRSVEITAERVGIGMTIAAACGMLSSVLAGRAADALGARNTAIFLVLVQGVAVCGYALVGGFAGFVVAVSVVISCHSAAEAARGALVAGVVTGEKRVEARAYLHSVTNVGISLGAVAGGFALHFDTRSVYIGLLFACGVLFAGSGLVYLLLPQVPPAEKPESGPRWEVLRDKPFAVFALLNALLVMNDGLLTVVLPLWIAQRTNAPVAVYSAILLLNTIMVVLFQVRVSKSSGDVAGGARALRRSGLLLAGCCALFALAAGQPAWLATAILVAGGLVHVLGELVYSAGSWALAYELAPEHAQGQYQGVFTMSIQLGAMLAPMIGTALIMGAGLPGWLVFAGVLLGAGLAAPAAARWAVRTRATVTG
ncbi:MFS transporter [Amycolatopsis lurida]